MNFRTYYDIGGKDRSGLGDQVGEQHRRVRERLATIRRVVVVASGKGGVGKSRIAASIAHQFVGTGSLRVGVLDADLTSPTIANLLGAAGPLRVTNNGVVPARGTSDIEVVSTDLLLDEGQPLQWKEPKEARFAWRGAQQVGVLREFLSDITWGDLDLLLIDAPPGVAILQDIHELIPNLTGAIFVTIPSLESSRSVARAIRAALEEGVQTLGIIENMSGMVCQECGERQSLFRGSAGADLSSEFGVPLLAQIPFSALSDGPIVLPSTVIDALMEVGT